MFDACGSVTERAIPWTLYHLGPLDGHGLFFAPLRERCPGASPDGISRTPVAELCESSQADGLMTSNLRFARALDQESENLLSVFLVWLLPALLPFRQR